MQKEADRSQTSQAQTAGTTTPTEVISHMGRRFLFLWPLVLGLAVGRSGLIAACYGSYQNTDDGLYTDGAMIVALLILFGFFLIITPAKLRIRKKWANRIARFCFLAEAITITLIGLMTLAGVSDFSLRFPVSVCCTVVTSGAIFYWLRRARGTTALDTVVFVFSALILSEILLYFEAIIMPPVDLFISAGLALLQFPCIIWARSRMKPYERSDEEDRKSTAGFFAFTDNILKSKRALVATAVGVALMSIVIGLLRGYPNGDAIAFTWGTRLAYGLLTIALSVVVIAFAVRGRRCIVSTDLFIIMGLLASAALVCYAAFPDQLAYGAVFTTALNALMVGFTWYLIVAFMSFGWRDPYYYAMSGWFVWLGARSCARTILLGTEPLEISDTFILALMGALVVVSTQVILMRFLRIECDHRQEQQPANNAAESAAPAALAPAAVSERDADTLTRLMGLDSAESLDDMRRATMRHSAEIIGEQFLLSEREVDVLALYALGFTQKRVAEELFITPSTTHAHIKRIYAKTGMHSRQEILDYISQYAS